MSWNVTNQSQLKGKTHTLCNEMFLCVKVNWQHMLIRKSDQGKVQHNY